MVTGGIETQPVVGERKGDFVINNHPTFEFSEVDLNNKKDLDKNFDALESEVAILELQKQEEYKNKVMKRKIRNFISQIIA